MKKQLLIAAVAATMGTAAIADVSITGGMKVNYVNTEFGTGHDNSDTPLTTNAFNQDLDLTIQGKSGGTTVSMTVATTDTTNDGTALKVEDTFLTTTIGDIAIKTGTWMTGDDMLAETSRNDGKFEASTTFSGVKVIFSDAENANGSVKVKTTVSNVAVSAEQGPDFETYTVDTDIAGFGIAYKMRAKDAADSDRSSIMLTKDFNGVGLTYASAEADTGIALEGDSWLGDYEGAGNATLNNGDDVSGFGAKMALAGNTVQVKSITVDATNDIDFTKFYVTRKLAGGSTFEAIYTDKDVAGSTSSDSKELDLELAVKF